MIFPPATMAKRGRANVDGRPILYASRNITTVLAELEGVTVGPTVEIAQIQTQTGIGLKVFVIGDLDHVIKSNISMLGMKEVAESINTTFYSASSVDSFQTALVDAFLSDLFSIPSEKAKCNAYYLTSLVAEAILQRLPTEALIYQSVMHRAGFNIAIPPKTFESRCRIVSILLANIEDVLPYNYFVVKPIKQSSQIGPEGEIVWGEPTKFPLPSVDSRTGKIVS